MLVTLSLTIKFTILVLSLNAKSAIESTCLFEIVFGIVIYAVFTSDFSPVIFTLLSVIEYVNIWS